MRIVFAAHSWEDYMYWQRTDRKILNRINMLVRDIVRHPYAGIGKPEPLKNRYRGYWSRRIDSEQRLIYKVVEDEIRIAKCRFHYD